MYRTEAIIDSHDEGRPYCEGKKEASCGDEFLSQFEQQIRGKTLTWSSFSQRRSDLHEKCGSDGPYRDNYSDSEH
jgi:hypothetical protein